MLSSFGEWLWIFTWQDNFWPCFDQLANISLSTCYLCDFNSFPANGDFCSIILYLELCNAQCMIGVSMQLADNAGPEQSAH